MTTQPPATPPSSYCGGALDMSDSVRLVGKSEVIAPPHLGPPYRHPVADPCVPKPVFYLQNLVLVISSSPLINVKMLSCCVSFCSSREERPPSIQFLLKGRVLWGKNANASFAIGED